MREEILPRGKSYTIVLVVDSCGNKLIKLRSLLEPIKWEGDWKLTANNPLWDSRIKNVIGQ